MQYMSCFDKREVLQQGVEVASSWAPVLLAMLKGGGGGTRSFHPLGFHDKFCPVLIGGGGSAGVLDLQFSYLVATLLTVINDKSITSGENKRFRQVGRRDFVEFIG